MAPSKYCGSVIRTEEGVVEALAEWFEIEIPRESCSICLIAWPCDCDVGGVGMEESFSLGAWGPAERAVALDGRGGDVRSTTSRACEEATLGPVRVLFGGLSSFWADEAEAEGPA